MIKVTSRTKLSSGIGISAFYFSTSLKNSWKSCFSLYFPLSPPPYLPPYYSFPPSVHPFIPLSRLHYISLLSLFPLIPPLFLPSSFSLFSSSPPSIPLQFFVSKIGFIVVGRVEMPECRTFWHLVSPLQLVKNLTMPEPVQYWNKAVQSDTICVGTGFTPWMPECRCRRYFHSKPMPSSGYH